MRWPFSIFTRGSHPPDDAADAVPSGPADEAATDADAGDQAGPATAPAAWRSLPAVQRATGPVSLTAPALPFARRLAGRNGPEPTLAPLAHEVATDGAIGLVGGLAEPLVQRATGPAAFGSGPAELSVAAGPQAAAGGHRTPGSRASHGVSVAALAPRFAGEPAEPPPVQAMAPRVLEAVATADIALDATHVAPVSAPPPVRVAAPVVSDGAAVDAPSAPPEPSPAPVLETGVGGVPSVASIADQAAPAAADPGATSQPWVSSMPPAPVGRRSLGESRRLGLGAPLASRPPVQRAAEGGPSLPLVGHGRTAHATPAATPPAPASLETPAAGASAALPMLRSLPADASTATGVPTVPVAEAGGDGGPGAVAAGRLDLPIASDAARRPADPARALQSSAGAVAGLGVTSADDAGIPGELPLAGPPAVAQRSASIDAGALPGGPAEDLPAASAAMPATVADDTSPIAGEAATASGATGARATTPPGIPGLAAAHPLAGASPTVQRLATMPLTVPGVPAAGRSSPVAERALVRIGGPAERAGAGSAGGTSAGPAVRPGVPAPSPGAVTSSVPTATVGPAWAAPRLGSNARGGPSGLAGRAPVAIAPGAAASADGYASAPPMPVVARRSADATDSPAPSSWVDGSFTTAIASFPSPLDGGPSGPAELARPGPAVQRAVTIGEMTTSAAADQGAGGATGGGAGGNQDMDALADKLYPKVRDRLTQDLLLERERAGLLGDW